MWFRISYARTVHSLRCVTLTDWGMHCPFKGIGRPHRLCCSGKHLDVLVAHLAEVFRLHCCESDPKSVFLSSLDCQSRRKISTKFNQRAWTLSRETNILLTAGNCNLVNWGLAVICGHIVVWFRSAFVCICAHSKKRSMHIEEYDPAAASSLWSSLRIKAPCGALRGNDDRLYLRSALSGSESAVCLHISSKTVVVGRAYWTSLTQFALQLVIQLVAWVTDQELQVNKVQYGFKVFSKHGPQRGIP